jgi:hypothetical protein
MSRANEADLKLALKKVRESAENYRKAYEAEQSTSEDYRMAYINEQEGRKKDRRLGALLGILLVVLSILT